MTTSDCYSFWGLVLNTFAGLILIIPKVSLWQDVEDEFIEEQGKDGRYYQRKHRKERDLNIFGLALLAAGFALQAFGILVA